MCNTNGHLAHKPRWTRFKMTGSDKIWQGSFLAVFENRNPYWMIIMKCGPGGHSLSWSPLELRNYVIFRYSWGHWIYHDVQWHIIRIHGIRYILYTISSWIHLCRHSFRDLLAKPALGVLVWGRGTWWRNQGILFDLGKELLETDWWRGPGGLEDVSWTAAGTVQTLPCSSCRHSQLWLPKDFSGLMLLWRVKDSPSSAPAVRVSISWR